MHFGEKCGVFLVVKQKANEVSCGNNKNNVQFKKKSKSKINQHLWEDNGFFFKDRFPPRVHANSFLKYF